MTVMMLAGAVMGAGAAVVWRAFLPRSQRLRPALDRLEATERLHAADPVPPGAAADLRQWAGSLIAERLGSRVEADLAVVERSTTRHATQKLTCALGLAGVVVGAGVLSAVGGVAVAPVGIAAAAVVCAACGYLVPDVTLRNEAERRRHEIRHALSCFLDLVNILLAGGSGVETALEGAAAAGDGWAFTQLRHALVRARSMRRSPWECFAELGRRVGVDELIETAASVQLAGAHGARIKASLAARAAALRGHESARIEARANAATERMSLPVVLLFLGFLVLLGYPAAQQIVDAW